MIHHRETGSANRRFPVAIQLVGGRPPRPRVRARAEVRGERSSVAARARAAATKAVLGHSFGFPTPLGSPERSGTPRYAAERRVTRSGTPGVERDCPFCQCQHTAVRKSHAGGRRLLAAATNAVCGHSVALAFPPLGSPKRSGMPRYAAERRGTLGHSGRRDCRSFCQQEITRAAATKAGLWAFLWLSLASGQ